MNEKARTLRVRLLTCVLGAAAVVMIVALRSPALPDAVEVGHEHDKPGRPYQSHADPAPPRLQEGVPDEHGAPQASGTEDQHRNPTPDFVKQVTHALAAPSIMGLLTLMIAGASMLQARASQRAAEAALRGVQVAERQANLLLAQEAPFVTIDLHPTQQHQRPIDSQGIVMAPAVNLKLTVTNHGRSPAVLLLQSQAFGYSDRLTEAEHRGFGSDVMPVVAPLGGQLLLGVDLPAHFETTDLGRLNRGETMFRLNYALVSEDVFGARTLQRIVYAFRNESRRYERLGFSRHPLPDPPGDTPEMRSLLRALALYAPTRT